MTLLAGTTTINTTTLADTGTGLSHALFGTLKSGLYDDAGTHDAKLAFLQSIAKLSDALASAVVTHIVSNAIVVVPALGLVAPPGTAGGPVTGQATGSVT